MDVKQIKRRKQRATRRLSDREVYDMRVAALEGALHRTLAAEHGVSQSTATRAIDGTTHTTVPHPVLAEGSPDTVGQYVFRSYNEAVYLLEHAAEGEVSVVEEDPLPHFTPSTVIRLMRELEWVEKLSDAYLAAMSHPEETEPRSGRPPSG
jgi:hypothetical protein